MALVERRRFAAALAQIERFSAGRSDTSDAIYARACTLISWRRDWEAKKLLLALIEQGNVPSKALVRLGWAHLGLHELEAARSCVRRAVELAPDDWEAHYALGEVLRVTDVKAAQESFARALQLSPENVHCLVNLSAGAIALKDYLGAERYARRATVASTKSAPAWVNLCLALTLLDRLDEAYVACKYCEAIPLDGSDSLVDNSNLGSVLHLMGRTEEAIAYFEDVLPKRPDAASSGHYALALLTAGHFAEGWRQYEFRWFDARLATQRAQYSIPPWVGQDLGGKIILLRCEQGVGDVLQFIRYAPMVKALGATVWLELRPGLGDLARMFEGVDRLISHGDRVDGFHFYADLLSLPEQFQTTIETVPARVPYVRAPDAARDFWRSRLPADGKPRIGLVWAGDPNHARDKQRSMPIEALEPLLSMSNLQWISLQKGIAAEQLANFHLAGNVIALGRSLQDYADTAAVIEQLDLIVTVDTSVAHLAGAMGKRVVVMLPSVADWRWLEQRDDSPWYPTMRLFRQEVAGDWSTVVQRVRDALGGGVLEVGSGQRVDLAVANSAGALDASKHAPSPERDSSRTVDMPLARRMRQGTIQYYGHPRDLARSLEYYGEYLEAQNALIRRMAKPEAFILEIGAGIGLQTMMLASAVTPNGNVLAIENCCALRRMLRQNIDANGVRGVEVIDAAIGRHLASADEIGCAHPGSPNDRECPVDGLHLGAVDCIVVSDADMTEAALDGAERTIWRYRPSIFLAVGSREALSDAATKVRDFGYRCWQVESPKFNPHNFYGRTDDIFAGAIALAIAAFPEERDPLDMEGLTCTVSEMLL